MGVASAIAAPVLSGRGAHPLYLATTFTAAIRTEEAFLRAGSGRPTTTTAAARRAPAGRSPGPGLAQPEWRAVLGMAAVFLVLA